MTLEEVLANDAEITHAQPLPKACMLQWHFIQFTTQLNTLLCC
jgi:hypothetical protein